jgi:hypothetical protein
MRERERERERERKREREREKNVECGVDRPGLPQMMPKLRWTMAA